MRSTIGAYCNVSPEEAAFLPYTLSPLLAHASVQTIIVLHTGATIPVEFGHVAASNEKVIELHRDFGVGYDTPVEEGGYDQLEARMLALQLVEEKCTDWIVQVDADELLTTSALDILSGAEDQHDIAVFDYYTLTSPESYWFEDRCVREFGRRLILDPHVLCWRRRLERKPELCKKSALLHRNKTRHCSIAFDEYPYWRTLAVNGLHHFHFHCLLRKPSHQRRTESKPFSETLPDEVRDCIRGIGSLQSRGRVYE